jgi:hypothetical protein
VKSNLPYGGCEVDSDCIVSNCNNLACLSSETVEDCWEIPENLIKADSCKCEDNKCQIRKDYLLSNGRKAEIKVMPSTASERAYERLGELGFNVEIKEVGKGENTKLMYELSKEKEAKILGLFRARGKVSALVDAETGEVEKVNRPWWAFLASGI